MNLALEHTIRQESGRFRPNLHKIFSNVGWLTQSAESRPSLIQPHCGDDDQTADVLNTMLRLASFYTLTVLF